MSAAGPVRPVDDGKGLRDRILQEIRVQAQAGGGKAPGQIAFKAATGIATHKWLGVFWPNWSEALAEAGFTANTFTAKLDSSSVLLQIISACRHYGHVPTKAEFMLYRQVDPVFPHMHTLSNHFQSRAGLLAELVKAAEQSRDFEDIAEMVAAAKLKLRNQGSQRSKKIAEEDTVEGYVYLLQSGPHYKIGRSADLERRVKQVSVALPDALTLVHAIHTDDPSGIEAYWHRRFADRRANGEWFKLTAADVAAFRRRKYQ